MASPPPTPAQNDRDRAVKDALARIEKGGAPKYHQKNAETGKPFARERIARLVDAVGPARAKELIFRARLVGAQEALAAGLLSEIVPGERLLERVREVAQELAEHAPLTLRATKEVIRRLQAARRQVEADDLVRLTYGSEDFREGVAAFVARRKPVFRGR